MLFYLILGAVVVAWLLWGKRKPLFAGEGWRVGAGVASAAAFAAAAYAGVRSQWPATLALCVLGLWCATSARQRPVIRKVAEPGKAQLSASEARSILGVDAKAGPDEIQAAYARLIRLAHPDKGGTAGLAAQLNAARDRLLKGR
ncbi:molecular chaperone DnaJ [Caulobacter sp. 602-2]|uniref:Molecular chaperone DnaJ n=1 Tax=Caulobacter sp. 602-2 TaxID=2710887 RepID=A0A6G4R188_9CAUL|nr:molecular chaperone DnaJ [Caulobacter sp. 602-2]NGM50938.1 molecular chaperone DnaJ [Caulobacter sp. 602-2]